MQPCRWNLLPLPRIQDPVTKFSEKKNVQEPIKPLAGPVSLLLLSGCSGKVASIGRRCFSHRQRQYVLPGGSSTAGRPAHRWRFLCRSFPLVRTLCPPRFASGRRVGQTNCRRAVCTDRRSIPLQRCCLMLARFGARARWAGQ